MAAVTRLLTFVDVDDATDARQISVSARHEAVLGDGRHVLLLDDRGWSESGPTNIWAATSVEDIVGTAHTVVGPDEPFGDRLHEDMEADHWAHLAGILRQQGIVADALDLKRLPHDVVLSERLLALVGHDQATPSIPDAAACVAGPATALDRSLRSPGQRTCAVRESVPADAPPRR